MVNILIIDDDPLITEMLKSFIDEIGHRPLTAGTLTRGLEMANSNTFDLIFLDVNLPDGNGLEALPLFKNTTSKPEVIIITAQGNTEYAKMALDYNAWDYIIKPFSNHEIQLIVKRALEFRASKTNFQSASENILDRTRIIGSSPKLIECLNKVARCAKNDTNILITGPTGAGKELFANVIHANSRQKEKRFVVLDCASLPEQLVESVLFGHVKGAYTGADSTRDGLIIKADGGTLFLDEIGELPLSIQKKFLRVLQERKFIPVGGTKEIKSNFRLVSATNRNLEEMVNQNQFRKDLFFRLKTIQIDLPGLKECKEDIKDLTLHYIYTLCKRHGFENKGFVPEFLDNLELYDWPGNTRELISSIERAILADPESPILYPNYLPTQIRMQSLQSSIDKNQNSSQIHYNSQTINRSESIDIPTSLFEPIQSLKQVKEFVISETEKRYLNKLLQLTKGDLDQASTLSCLSKGRIYALLKKYDMSRSI